MNTPRARTQGYWVALVMIGVVGGVLSGLFAIGGGILMVPLLTWRAHLDQRAASATSLVAIIPTAITSSGVYFLKGEVDVAAGIVITIGAISGAVIGSALLRRISVAALTWMFITFIMGVAVRLLFVTPQRGHFLTISPRVAMGYIALGLAMGVASGLFGIGGGIIAVPLLISFFASSDLVAKGTSLLVTIPTSTIGTVANRHAGIVDVRAGVVVGFAAAAASIPAARLALLMSARLSSLLFAALLVGVATQLSVKAARASRREGFGADPLPRL